MPKKTGTGRRGTGQSRSGQETIVAGSGLPAVDTEDRIDRAAGQMRVPGGAGELFPTSERAAPTATPKRRRRGDTPSASGGKVRLGQDRVKGGQG